MTNPSTELARDRRDRAPRRGGARGRARARLAQRAAVVRARTTPHAGRWRSGCTRASTSARPASSPSGWPRSAGAPRPWSAPPAPPWPTSCPAVRRGRARRCAARRRHRRPAGAAARHRRQPDHRPGRASSGRSRRRSTSPPPTSTQLLAFLRAHDHRRPVHLNVQLDDPLLPDDALGRSATVPPWAAPARAPLPSADRSSTVGPRTVVVAGDDAGPPARVLAEQAGWPLLAEPSSGCRTGDTRHPHLPAAARRRARRPGRARRRLRPPHAVPTGRRACSRATTSRWSRSGTGAVVAATVPGRRASTTRRRVERTGRPGVARGLARRGPLASAGSSTALLAAEPDLTPYEVAGAVSRAAAAGRAAVRRRLQPDPRPRPDGRPLRGRRAPQGDRQPRPGRHRRHHQLRHRRRPRPPAVDPRARADGRRDVPARHDRPVPRPARGAPGPDDRRGQRRRRLDLRHPRAGRTGVRRPLRHALRHPARRRHRQPVRGRAHPAPAGHQPARAGAGPGLAQRRHRGRRGARTPRQPRGSWTDKIRALTP